MDHDVFISYSSQNKEAAQAICHALEQNEIRCWMAPRDIPYGAQYGDVIDDAIKTCKVVVVLFSETAASSQWVNGELNVAFEEQKTIIPFRLDQTPLKGQTRVMLNQRHWIDAYPDYKTKFKDLVNAVAQAIGKTVQLEPDSTKISIIIKRNKNHIMLSIIMIALIAVAAITYLFIPKPIHTFTYDKQGMYVNINGLSAEQEEALTSILDNMVWVEGGFFEMGNYSRIIDEQLYTEQDNYSIVSHPVIIKGFYISKYEITQEQWNAFAELSCVVKEIGKKKPVDYTSWEQCKMFTDSLSAITGLKISLPTEAQWEYAARDGKSGVEREFFYSGSDDPLAVGWILNPPDSIFIHEVGMKTSNHLGLFDMTGNVSEWCLDDFSPYTANEQTNPCINNESDTKVIRGGGINTGLRLCKVTTRDHWFPTMQREATGFRIVINK